MIPRGISRTVRIVVALAIAVCGGVPDTLWAVRTAQASSMPKPAGLQKQVDFWIAIFAKYSSYHVVVHDALHLDRVYTVLDFESLVKSGASEADIQRTREQRAETEKKRIRAILLRLHQLGGQAQGLSREETRVRDMFVRESGANKFRDAAERIRTQRGLRDRFMHGVETAHQYLPHMKAIFRAEGLPLELVWLPLVESGFNLKAYSKTGAAGIWQFMPSTGRRYMRIDDYVDERRDPLLATAAAARHLKGNYEALGHWPLALTAYNHGRAGIARAVKAVGSEDIVTIIRHYKGRTFGFASRNFYAEFLAAVEVGRNAEHYYGKISPWPLLQTDTLTLPHYVPFHTLARTAGIEPSALAALNPALSRRITAEGVRVPKGYRLRLPAGTAKAFRARYAQLPASQKHSRQHAAGRKHRVRRGETLGQIAHRYGTSVSAIKRHNRIRNANHVRVGQVLTIPGRGRGSAAKSAPARTTKTLRHRVRSGETLGQIAHRYGTSVKALMRQNDIRDARRVRVGQLLTVRGQDTGASRTASRAGGGTHRVRTGESLYSIARRYGTTVKALQRHNNIRDARHVRVGQVLSLPGAGSGARTAKSASVVKHRVRKGETLSSIAQRYRIGMRAIQRRNNLRSAHHLRVGQVLLIPK